MKLIRFGIADSEEPGIIDENGNWRSTAAFQNDYNEEFFSNNGIEKLREWLDKNLENCPIIDKSTRLGPPVHRPSKLICIGLNYAGHAKESGMNVPKEPVIFFKATSAICGPYDDLVIPKNSQKTDWEVELAVVIGKKANYVTKDEAMNYVAGYMLHNDYSEREWQLERGGQWVKGKSCDTFAPLGPYMATTDEVDDPHNLNLWLKLNGEMLQNGNTNDFIFDIPAIISYLSQCMSLLPGDVISTGTPSGVGLGFDPPKYLKPGDEIELGIEKLGISKQKAVVYKN